MELNSKLDIRELDTVYYDEDDVEVEPYPFEQIAPEDEEEEIAEEEELSEEEQGPISSIVPIRIIGARFLRSGKNMNYIHEESNSKLRQLINKNRITKDQPPDIDSKDFIECLAFHPKTNVLAAGTIASDILLYKYADKHLENLHKNVKKNYSMAVRDVKFNSTGDLLYSICQDKSFIVSDVNTGQIVRSRPNISMATAKCINICNDAGLFAVADSWGAITCWDIRTNMRYPVIVGRSVSNEEIWSMSKCESTNMLHATIGNDNVLLIDIVAGRIISERSLHHVSRSPLKCSGFFEDSTKFVIGSSDGLVIKYGWEKRGFSDDATIPWFNDDLQKKISINCMLPISPRLACVGGLDGCVRVIDIYNANDLGTIGQHALAVQAMAISNDREFIASSSYDDGIKLWDIKYISTFRDNKRGSHALNRNVRDDADVEHVGNGVRRSKRIRKIKKHIDV